MSSILELDTTESGGGGWSLTISESAPILGDCHIGDSISVNGCCLTVTEFDDQSFKVGLAPETLNRTNLGADQRAFVTQSHADRVRRRAQSGRQRRPGTRSKRARALWWTLRAGARAATISLARLITTKGHVDETATIASRTLDGNSLRLLFKLPEPTPERPSLLPYLIPKGFIAIDGASLTLTSVDDADHTFGVMLVAHTQSKIVLAAKPVGARVNIEVDMVGKYVEKAVQASLGGESGAVGSGLSALIERVVENVLAKKGLRSNWCAPFLS